MEALKTNSIIGTAYYKGSPVTIIGEFGQYAVVIISHNPIEVEQVKYSKLDNIRFNTDYNN